MLSQEQIHNKWNEIKGGIRNLWGRLSEEELDEYKNNPTEVSHLVEERYGETKEEIKKKMQQLMDSFDNDSDKNFSINESSYQRKPQGDDDEDESAYFRPGRFDKTDHTERY